MIWQIPDQKYVEYYYELIIEMSMNFKVTISFLDGHEIMEGDFLILVREFFDTWSWIVGKYFFHLLVWNVSIYRELTIFCHDQSISWSECTIRDEYDS